MNIIDYITKNTDFKQKDIAERLKISRAQVSKWKAGESIPLGRQDELRELGGLFGYSTEWALFAKDEKNSQAWASYIIDMNELGEFGPCTQLEDESEFYTPSIILMLVELGADIPMKAPIIDRDDEHVNSKFEDFMLDYISEFSALSQWHEHYMPYTVENTELDEFYGAINSYIRYLTLRYLGDQTLQQIGINLERYEDKMKENMKDLRTTICDMCELMNGERIPFTTDYFDIINKSPFDLFDEMAFIRRRETSSVNQLLPYGERLILTETRKTNVLLSKLNEKLDLIDIKLNLT